MNRKSIPLTVYLVLISIFFVWQGLFSDESPQTATLIVTYQTDHKGERLDRIRFWIKNENHKQWLFPKGEVYVAVPDEMSRMVVIEDLSPGQYTLEFLVPNTDQYFEEVSTRKVIVAKGDVVKIEQIIKPRHFNWEIESESDEDITLWNSSVHKNKEPDFFPLESPENEGASEEVMIVDKPDEVVESSPAAFGKLIVSYDINEDQSLANQIRFRLVGERGNTSIHPTHDKDTVIPLKGGCMIMVQNLPVGKYTLHFFVEGENEQPHLSSQQLIIAESKTLSIHRSLSVPRLSPAEVPSIGEQSK